jgi:hypothetical protein
MLKLVFLCENEVWKVLFCHLPDVWNKGENYVLLLSQYLRIIYTLFWHLELQSNYLVETYHLTHFPQLVLPLSILNAYLKN